MFAKSIEFREGDRLVRQPHEFDEDSTKQIEIRHYRIYCLEYIYMLVSDAHIHTHCIYLSIHTYNVFI